MSFNLDKAFPGALSTGFLPPQFSVVDINPESAVKGMALDQKAVELLEERWQLLSRLREVSRPRLAGYGREMASYENFYETAHKLLSDERWPAAFRIGDDDRKRYGNTPLGISAVLARNVLAQDAGTHYIHICHPGWDHHVQIWDRKASSNHYALCAEFDPAFTSLLEDLGRLRSKTNPEKTLLDETLVVAMSEFGRTPGALNNMQGRDHYNRCFPAMFAGAGVKGGRALGRTDADGAKVPRHRLGSPGAAPDRECRRHHVFGAWHRLGQGSPQHAIRSHLCLCGSPGRERCHSHRRNLNDLRVRSSPRRTQRPVAQPGTSLNQFQIV